MKAAINNIKLQDLTAVKLLHMLTSDLDADFAIIQQAIEQATHVSAEIFDENKYTACVFSDQSVFAFHWGQDQGKITSLQVIPLFAYQEESQIPQCVKEQQDIIGTIRYAFLSSTSETIH